MNILMFTGWQPVLRSAGCQPAIVLNGAGHCWAITLYSPQTQ